MNVDQEVADYQAAGALAEEIPYWGWLDDGRTCLTRAGELLCLARLTPAVLDGRTPEQLDAVLNRWQRYAFRGRFTDAHLLLSVSTGQPLRPRRAGRAIHRCRHLAAEAAGFSEQPRSTNPDLHCLDLRPSPFIRLRKAGPNQAWWKVLPTELACPPAQPSRISLSTHRNRSSRQLASANWSMPHAPWYRT